MPAKTPTRSSSQPLTARTAKGKRSVIAAGATMESHWGMNSDGQMSSHKLTQQVPTVVCGAFIFQGG